MVNEPFAAHVRAQDAQQPETTIIDLSGEINAFAEDDLNTTYAEAEGFNTPVIVLNFGQVTYINSTGIALIVALLARARKTGRRLAVYGLSDHYEDIFRITRLSDFMSIYSDETTALAEL